MGDFSKISTVNKEQIENFDALRKDSAKDGRLKVGEHVYPVSSQCIDSAQIADKSAFPPASICSFYVDTQSFSETDFLVDDATGDIYVETDAGFDKYNLPNEFNANRLLANPEICAGECAGVTEFSKLDITNHDQYSAAYDIIARSADKGFLLDVINHPHANELKYLAITQYLQQYIEQPSELWELINTSDLDPVFRNAAAKKLMTNETPDQTRALTYVAFDSSFFDATRLYAAETLDEMNHPDAAFAYSTLAMDPINTDEMYLHKNQAANALWKLDQDLGTEVLFSLSTKSDNTFKQRLEFANLLLTNNPDTGVDAFLNILQDQTLHESLRLAATESFLTQKTEWSEFIYLNPALFTEKQFERATFYYATLYPISARAEYPDVLRYNHLSNTTRMQIALTLVEIDSSYDATSVYEDVIQDQSVPAVLQIAAAQGLQTSYPEMAATALLNIINTTKYPVINDKARANLMEMYRDQPENLLALIRDKSHNKILRFVALANYFGHPETDETDETDLPFSVIAEIIESFENYEYNFEGIHCTHQNEYKGLKRALEYYATFHSENAETQMDVEFRIRAVENYIKSELANNMQTSTNPN